MTIISTSHPVYASYLVFQLFSHKALCEDDNEDVQPTKGYEGENPFRLYSGSSRKNITDGESVLSPPDSMHEGMATTDVEHGSPSTEAPEQPQMSVAVCICLLVVVTVVRTNSDG